MSFSVLLLAIFGTSSMTFTRLCMVATGHLIRLGGGAVFLRLDLLSVSVIRVQQL
jgi:hypothetical protein